MTHETKMRKRHDGWAAESEQKLQDVAADSMGAAGERIIKLSTSKGPRGGISSFVSVCIRRRENGYQSEQVAMFEDYAKWYNVTPCARVTEKAIQAAHAVALQTFADHIAAAKVQYGISEQVAA